MITSRSLGPILSLGIFVPALFTSGCADKDSNLPDRKLTEFAMNYARSWSSSWPQMLAAHYAEDGMLQINDGDPAEGREAIAAVAQSFMTALPDMVVRMDSLTISSGHPQFHWTLFATNSGPDGNGKTIQISGYEEWTLNSEGLILKSFGHMDSDEYARQLEHGYP